MTDEPATAAFRAFLSRRDPRALADAFDRTAPDLLRVARHLMRDEASAEDLVQQTFLTAIERAATFRTDSALKPWLLGILFRHAREEWRRRLRVRRIAESEDELLAPSAIDVAARREIEHEVTTAVLALASPYREVVAANLLRELPPRRIAEASQRPVARVRLQLHRGLARLRRLLPRSLAAASPLTPRGLAAMRESVVAAGVGQAKGWIGGTIVSVSGKQLGAVVAVTLLVCGASALLRSSRDLGAEPSSAAAIGPGMEGRDDVDGVVEAVPDATREAVVPETTPARHATRRAFGRVVDLRRFPVAGARVERRVDGLIREVTRTDDRGEFDFAVAAIAGFDTSFLAFTDDGRVGGRSGAQLSNRHEYSVGVIVVEPAGGMRIRATIDGRPVPGAEVRLRSRRLHGDARTTTGEDGLAVFERVPKGSFHATVRLADRHASALVYAPDDREVAVDLPPRFDRSVLVIDAGSQLPIPDAEVVVRENVWMERTVDPDLLAQTTSEYLRSVPVDLGSRRTDGFGRLLLCGLDREAAYSVDVIATGYETYRSGMSSELSRGRAMATVRLRRVAPRSVRFPIRAGEAPIPAPGTRLRLQWSESPSPYGAPPPPLPPFVVMGDREVVVDELNPPVSLLAHTDDGLVAELRAVKEQADGLPSSFARSRTIRVRVEDPQGRPVANGLVRVKFPGGRPWPLDAPLDAEGLAEITGLPRADFDVFYVTSEDWRTDRRIGRSAFEDSDREFRYVLPVTASVRVRILRDGVPELPARFRLGLGAPTTMLPTAFQESDVRCSVLAEDPARGELLVEIEAQREAITQPRRIGIVCGDGAAGGVDIVPVLEGEPPIADIRLESTAILDVVVRRGVSTDPVELRVHGLADVRGNPFHPSSVRESKLLRPNGPHGSYRFEGLAAGRYEIVDERSETRSAPFDLAPGSRAEVTLEIP